MQHYYYQIHYFEHIFDFVINRKLNKTIAPLLMFLDFRNVNVLIHNSQQLQQQLLLQQPQLQM